MYNVDNVKVRYSKVNDKAFARGIDFRINGEFVSRLWKLAQYLHPWNQKKKILGVQPSQDAFSKPVTWVPRPCFWFLHPGSLVFSDYLPMNRNFKTLPTEFPEPVYLIVLGKSYQTKCWHKAYQRVAPWMGQITLLRKTQTFLRWTQRSYLNVESFNLLDVQKSRIRPNWVKDFNNICVGEINLTNEESISN